MENALSNLILVGSVWGVFFMMYAVSGEKLPIFIPVIVILLAIYFLLSVAYIILSMLKLKKDKNDSYEKSELVKYLRSSSQWTEIADKASESVK